MSRLSTAAAAAAAPHVWLLMYIVSSQSSPRQDKVTENSSQHAHALGHQATSPQDTTPLHQRTTIVPDSRSAVKKMEPQTNTSATRAPLQVGAEHACLCLLHGSIDICLFLQATAALGLQGDSLHPSTQPLGMWLCLRPVQGVCLPDKKISEHTGAFPKPSTQPNSMLLGLQAVWGLVLAVPELPKQPGSLQQVDAKPMGVLLCLRAVG